MARTIHDWRKAVKLRYQRLAEDEDLMRLATWQQIITNCEDEIYSEGYSDKIVNYDDDYSGNDDDDDNKAKHSARDWAGPPRDVGSYCFEQKLKIDPSPP